MGVSVAHTGLRDLVEDRPANRERILAAVELGLSNSKLEGLNSRGRGEEEEGRGGGEGGEGGRGGGGGGGEEGGRRREGGGGEDKIRLINHRGYGHHTAAALIAMIYLCCGGITIELPTAKT